MIWIDVWCPVLALALGVLVGATMEACIWRSHARPHGRTPRYSGGRFYFVIHEDEYVAERTEAGRHSIQAAKYRHLTQVSPGGRTCPPSDHTRSAWTRLTDAAHIGGPTQPPPLVLVFPTGP